MSENNLIKGLLGSIVAISMLSACEEKKEAPVEATEESQVIEAPTSPISDYEIEDSITSQIKDSAKYAEDYDGEMSEEEPEGYDSEMSEEMTEEMDMDSDSEASDEIAPSEYEEEPAE